MIRRSFLAGLLSSAAAVPAAAQAWRPGFAPGFKPGFQFLQRPPLPLPTPVLLEAFDSLTGYTIGGGPQNSIDTTRKVQGTGSLRLEGKGTGTTMTATKSLGSIDLASDDVIVWYVDVEKPNIDANAANITLERGGTYYGPGLNATAVLYNDQYAPRAASDQVGSYAS